MTEDGEIGEVMAALGSGVWKKELQRFQDVKEELSIKDGFLLRGNRFVLPEGLRMKALSIAHSSHPGVTTMKRALRQRLWWPGMDVQIVEKCERCEDCILVSKDGPPAPMKRTSLPFRKWDYIALDFYSAKNPDFTVLVAVDYFSRYTMARLVKSTDFQSTSSALEEIFEWLGKPRKVIADNGSPFQSADFKRWCEAQGIKLIHSTPLWPRQNGMVERFMPNITRVASIAKKNGESIKEAIRTLVYDYNRRPHATTGESPISVLLGRENLDKFPCADLLTADVDEEQEDQFRGLRIRDAEQKEKGRAYSDKYNRARESTVSVGDTVVIKNSDRAKLAPNFNPRKFTVVEKRGEELTMRDADGAIMRRNTALTKTIPETESTNESARKSFRSSLIFFQFLFILAAKEKEPIGLQTQQTAPASPAPEPPTTSLRRSKRERALPIRFRTPPPRD